MQVAKLCATNLSCYDTDENIETKWTEFYYYDNMYNESN